MRLKRLEVGPFQMNCYVLVCEKTGEAAVIDPGDEPEHILTALAALGGAKVRYLLHTHAHLDHAGATRALREALPDRPPIVMHREDEFIYKMLPAQGQMFGQKLEPPLPVDQYLEDGQELALGDRKLTVIHTPGHSPGGVCLRMQGEKGGPDLVFSGDTLFREGVGRTDLWGGDTDLLLRSIRERLLTLPDETRIYPGHGPESTIGHEKTGNPFL